MTDFYYHEIQIEKKNKKKKKEKKKKKKKKKQHPRLIFVGASGRALSFPLTTTTDAVDGRGSSFLIGLGVCKGDIRRVALWWAGLGVEEGSKQDDGCTEYKL